MDTFATVHCIQVILNYRQVKAQTHTETNKRYQSTVLMPTRLPHILRTILFNAVIVRRFSNISMILFSPGFEFSLATVSATNEYRVINLL